MLQIERKTIGDSVLLFEDDLLADVSVDMFSADFWQQQHKVTGQAFGRGVTTFFQQKGREYVLRHYRRGGLVGKVLHDQYVFTGVERTRAWQEMHLLKRMHQWGLPVPKAAAAHICRSGLIYTADIILEKIPLAQDVFSLLEKQPLSPAAWTTIGAVIKQMHDKQVFHHDLNIHNIMQDVQGKIWLIDFDKCYIRKGEQWKNENLQRLLRSLRKERSKNALFCWQEDHWQWCLSGYQGTNL